MTETSIYLKHKVNNRVLPVVGKKDFNEVKRVKIADLIPNQKHVDFNVVEQKRKGKNLTTVYVLNLNGDLILMDGHHTVISKLLNGQQYVFCRYLKA